MRRARQNYPRGQVAAAANSVSSAFEPPRLTERSPREALVRWLALNEPHADSYSDKERKEKGLKPLTLAQAWKSVERMTRGYGMNFDAAFVLEEWQRDASALRPRAARSR